MKSAAISLFFIIVIIITCFSWIVSCTHETDISNIPELCFDRDILPVFRNSCALTGCHDGTGESDLVLNSYQGIMEGIEPGNPSDSEIYEAITDTGEDIMPPDQPLSIDNRTLIRVWIEQGANETTCPGK